VTWQVPARRRLVLLVAGLAVILLPATFSPALPVLALLAGLAGVLVSPALATAYVLTDSLAPPQARNRAGNWVNSGYNAGSAAGSVVAGQLIGRIPLTACLPVLAAPALLAVLPLLRLRVTPAGEQPAAPVGSAGGAAEPVAEAGDW
jgi:predicted MFS family arabinose efflux permease